MAPHHNQATGASNIDDFRIYTQGEVKYLPLVLHHITMNYLEYKLRIIGFLVLLFLLGPITLIIYAYIGFSIAMITGIIIIAIAMFIIQPVIDYLKKISNEDV